MEHNVEAIEAIGLQPRNVQLADIVDDVSANANKSEAVSHAFDKALSQAMTLPGQSHGVTDARADLMSGSTGVVGTEKSHFVSEVQRPGTEPSAAEVEDELDTVAEHVRSLYAEMTNWQVAWSIAQRSQQDISHLLKGN